MCQFSNKDSAESIVAYFGDDENVLAPDLAGREPLRKRAADDVLVLVIIGGVDVSVAHLEGGIERFFQFFLVALLVKKGGAKFPKKISE